MKAACCPLKKKDESCLQQLLPVPSKLNDEHSKKPKKKMMNTPKTGAMQAAGC
jgi:hypothetical protein